MDLAVSTVIFALRPHPKTGRLTLWLPLVRRNREPYSGMWALPGGPLAADHDLVASARQTLGLDRRPRCDVSRSSCTRSVRSTDRASRRATAPFRSSTGRSCRATRSRRAVDGVEWFVADDVPELAFDHNEIVEYALARLRAKITYSPIALAFVGEEFTLADLRTVHEAVLRKPLDPANFRRQMLAGGTVVPTGACLQGASHRPPALTARLRR